MFNFQPKKGISQNYIENFITYIDPKIIITHIDNNSLSIGNYDCGWNECKCEMEQKGIITRYTNYSRPNVITAFSKNTKDSILQYLNIIKHSLPYDDGYTEFNVPILIRSSLSFCKI